MPNVQTIAVVPIFITAGSAVLPTVLAAVTGAAAVLLRPRELVGLIRRRPAATAGVIAAVSLSVWLAVRLAAPAKAKPVGVDWADVARQILARQAALAAAVDTPAATRPAGAIVEARDFARRSSDGGPGPLGLKPLWTYRPDDTMFLATPAVAGDRVFVAGCVSDLGGYTGLLACLDANTGRAVWEVTEINGEPLKAFFSSPAVTADGRRVVVGQGFHQDKNCALLCFDAATGKPQWSAASTEHIESSPAIEGDLAVVGVGAIEDKSGRPTGDPGHLLAVEISTGRVLWTHAVTDAESSPAIDADGTVYVGSGLNGDAVVAVTDSQSTSPAAGVRRERWRTPIGLSVTGAVTLAGDAVVVGAGNGDFAHSSASPEGAVVALDRVTGRERWRARMADGVLGPVAFDGDRLFAPVRTGELVALDAASGRVAWRTEISRPFPMLAGCAIAGDRVYAMAADGTLAVLDRADGRVIEKHALNAPGLGGSGLSSAAPQVVGGRAYVASETGGVQCFVGTGGRP